MNQLHEVEFSAYVAYFVATGEKGPGSIPGGLNLVCGYWIFLLGLQRSLVQFPDGQI